MVRALLLAALLLAAGCNNGRGPDSIFAPKITPTGERCLECHDGSNAITPDPLVTNGTGTAGKHVGHVQNAGISCERCHNDYDLTATHMNGTIETGDPAVRLVLFDTLNPSATWTGDTGPGTGTCAATFCHGGYSVDWYGTSLPSCAACHFLPMGTRRPVLGANGEFGLNGSILSHHVTSTGDPTSDQCQVCHDMSLHMSGTVRLKQADTGAIVVYSAADPSTAEPFCLSCHDTNGAGLTFVSSGTPSSPFDDGSNIGVAPNRASAEIAAQWNKTYGHRKQGLTCLGNGTANTGCHGGGHGTASVGLLARNLTLPNTKTNWFAPADEPDYDLCFTCHAGYPGVTKEDLFGASPTGNYYVPGITPYDTSGIVTLFRDRNSSSPTKTYEDPHYFTGDYANLHPFHLQIGGAWDYRDTISSSINCLSCHSVHGSDALWGWLYDSVQYEHFAGSGPDIYGLIGAPGALLGDSPTSCTFNCHDIMGTTHSWFEPSGE